MISNDTETPNYYNIHVHKEMIMEAYLQHIIKKAIATES